MTDPVSTREAAAWLRQRQAAARPHILTAAGAGTLAGLATIVQLGVMAWVAHQTLVGELALQELSGAILVAVAAIAVRGLMQRQQGRSAARASDRIRSDLRNELLRHWGQQGPASTGAVSAGTLASEWLDQVDNLHGYYARFQPQLILCLSVPLMILAVVLWLDWLAALFLLLSAPLIPLFMSLVGMGAEKLNQQHMETLGRLSGHFLDQVRGLTTLQLFGATRPAMYSIAEVTEDYRQVTLKTLRVAFLSSAVLEFFASVAIAVVAVYIGFGLLGYIRYGPSPELTLFSGLFILLLAPEFFQPLRTLAQHYHDRAAALGAAAQIRARLTAPGPQQRAPSEWDQRPPGSADTLAAPVVSAESLGVCVGSPPRPLLTDLNFQVQAGGSMAITGPSGSGKSTLLAVLAGFQVPACGRVRVAGGKPGDQPAGWLGQSPFIRHGTWADNLQSSAPGASEQAMEEALAQVGLAGIVRSRPLGVHTPIGEGGSGLSGGQARRLALARLFLTRYPLILLDEPTAGLDQHSEALVIRALKQLQADGQTLIVATHHPALINSADQVLQLRPAGGTAS